MSGETLAIILSVWQVIGVFVLVMLSSKVKFLGNCNNSDFFMPTYIYKHCKVNYFGTLMLFLFVNILCPVWSFGFWFYKLCTVGRKDYEGT